MHIVEELIAERAPGLIFKPRLFKVIKRMLAYDEAVRLADLVQPLTGRDAFARVSEQIGPRISVTTLGNVPKTGKCVVIANHPTGLADGLAVFKALQDRRPDHLYLANADALRVMPQGSDIIIPVEWVKSKRTHSKARDTLLAVKAALEEDRCVVIFPSGALATLGWLRLVDRPWQSSAAMLARKYKAPIIPLQIKAWNSVLYYVFSKLSAELRDITLFYELLNKKEKTFRLTFGAAIPPEDVSKNAEDATEDIRKIVEGL